MHIQRILALYPFLKDKDYVFKSCCREWIVVMEKLPDTITNETRTNIDDVLIEKYRANKLRVLLIFNKFDPTETKMEIFNSVYSKKKIKYKVGHIVSVNDFDNYDYIVCGAGIHYFKSIIPAFSYELDFVFDNRLSGWRIAW